MKFSVFSAALLETAAFLLLCTGRADWTERASFSLFAGSLACWTLYGANALNRRM